MDDEQIAFNALYIYLKSGGKAKVVDHGGDKPMRDRPVTIEWRLESGQLYNVAWWKAMHRAGRKP